MSGYYNLVTADLHRDLVPTEILLDERPVVGETLIIDGAPWTIIEISHVVEPENYPRLRSVTLLGIRPRET